MTKHEELEAALAHAEAALANAVLDAARNGADRTAAAAYVEKVRAYCRRARAALIKQNHLDTIGRSPQEIDILIGHLLEISKQGTGASPPSRQSGEHAVRGGAKKPQNESRRTKQSPRDTLARRSLIRQAIGLLALTLAYLQYYFLEVQVQILSLPAVFPGPFR